MRTTCTTQLGAFACMDENGENLTQFHPRKFWSRKNQYVINLIAKVVFYMLERV